MTWQRQLFIENYDGRFLYWWETRDFWNTIIESDLSKSDFIH